MSTDTATQRVFNFSAGPANLPLPVLETIRNELIALPSAGASILEISHRSSEFLAILADAQRRLKDLLSIPDNYRVLFLQGGSRLQFSMIPMNLLDESHCADYVITGSWGQKAIEEAGREGETSVLWDGRDTNYNDLPTMSELSPSTNSAYVHLTSNETIQGVQFHDVPRWDVPVICDCSSDFLSRPIDVAQYGLIYACAQKNAGPAGVTVVIIRDDLLSRSRKSLPGYLSYQNHAAHDSLYNTPPTFGIYVVGLIARWLQEEIGGLDAMARRNEKKAGLLYEVIDQSDGFYVGHSQREHRSNMNVTFRLPSDDLQTDFLVKAKKRQLCSLEGHRSVGGIRASIYNAMPVEGVEQLRDLMLEFAASSAGR
jgi:phosphoserine aminotransferase